MVSFLRKCEIFVKSLHIHRNERFFVYGILTFGILAQGLSLQVASASNQALDLKALIASFVNKKNVSMDKNGLGAMSVEPEVDAEKWVDLLGHRESELLSALKKVEGLKTDEEQDLSERNVQALLAFLQETQQQDSINQSLEKNDPLSLVQEAWKTSVVETANANGIVLSDEEVDTIVAVVQERGLSFDKLDVDSLAKIQHDIQTEKGQEQEVPETGSALTPVEMVDSKSRESNNIESRFDSIPVSQNFFDERLIEKELQKQYASSPSPTVPGNPESKSNAKLSDSLLSAPSVARPANNTTSTLVAAASKPSSVDFNNSVPVALPSSVKAPVKAAPAATDRGETQLSHGGETLIETPMRIPQNYSAQTPEKKADPVKVAEGAASSQKQAEPLVKSSEQLNYEKSMTEYLNKQIGVQKTFDEYTQMNLAKSYLDALKSEDELPSATGFSAVAHSLAVGKKIDPKTLPEKKSSLSLLSNSQPLKKVPVFSSQKTFSQLLSRFSDPVLDELAPECANGGSGDPDVCACYQDLSASLKFPQGAVAGRENPDGKVYVQWQSGKDFSMTKWANTKDEKIQKQITRFSDNIKEICFGTAEEKPAFCNDYIKHANDLCMNMELNDGYSLPEVCSPLNQDLATMQSMLRSVSEHLRSVSFYVEQNGPCSDFSTQVNFLSSFLEKKTQNGKSRLELAQKLSEKNRPVKEDSLTRPGLSSH